MQYVVACCNKTFLFLFFIFTLQHDDADDGHGDDVTNIIQILAHGVCTLLAECFQSVPLI